jgi:PAS domain S-box-containing protein
MGREGRDEFARIAGAINQWLETGQQANLQEDQSRIELEEENMALHLEVSQLRHLREELKEARRKYETFLEQAPVAMLLAQPQGQVLEANRRAQQLWGLSRDELVGRPLATLFTAEWPAALAAQILESQGDEFSQPCPIAIITRDGNEAPVALNMAFLSQDPPGLIHLALWDAPAGSASQGEAPSMPDTQFLADISREMQLQLNHLLNTSLALQEGVSPEMSNGRFEKLADIVGSGQRLLELTDNLEDILDAKFKRRKLEPATCTIKDILQGAMDSAVAAASRQRVVMTAETLPAADLLVHADPGVLRKVVAQLVHNAVKLSPQGGEVQVKARLANAVEVKGLAPASAAGADLPTSQGGYLTIQVSDQGIGVSPEDLPRLCEKMTPMDHLYKTQFAGAGVSLVLAKSLTALHGGVIWADCQVGRGSTFTVVLPQRQSVAEPMPRLAEPEAAAEAQATADDHEAGALPAAQSA